MASISFNVTELPENDGYDLIPDGWYNATVKSAELKVTKPDPTTNISTGKYIAIGYTITGPTHGGRVVFGNLNIKNASQDAERIGLQGMRSLMEAIGLNSVKDTDQFVGGKCSIKIGTGKKQEGYEQRNEVKGWKSTGDVIPFPVAGTPAATPRAPWA